MGRQLPQPTVDSIDLSTVLAALADPVRLDIMRTLYQRGEPLNCTALAKDSGVEVSAPTISHHWKVLRAAGLTTTEVVGRNRIIRIRRTDLEQRFPGLLDAVLGAADRPTSESLAGSERNG
ncbi:helix-turn-helix transcriptional regulator [Microlunatus sp. Gsoil 973]|jgi:DNA-binding transcriptional ArsR family regulator|uniref:ArsR/SmtB family transcription factor n=1 Tax=Microlunatus sp. Gsoil 973 TaxID=2672569 RepID=UPI0012B47313|nr:helix-turn-helix transcriptional regulator [Microlunatus sp. Gsoil 973]QGN33906.1 helix-turn-helix domain-containing protein [Microlunatus sp. Gsoil 973]